MIERLFSKNKVSGNNGVLLFLFLLLTYSAMAQEQPKSLSPPDPKTNPGSALMLDGDWVPEDPHAIDFENLPRIPAKHRVINDVSKEDGVNQHNYLIRYNGKFWVMWSDGPGVEDRVGQVVKYANSKDGLNWSDPKMLTPYPPHSEPDSPHYNTRSDEGFRWISRGFWKRDGELLALASLDEAAGFFGPDLELRAFCWDDQSNIWEDAGVVWDDAINNFPPKKLPTGEWLMSRRTHDYAEAGIQFLVGGNESIFQWESFEVPGSSDILDSEEPYWWILPDGENLMSLYRDNRGSGYLYRSFSTDYGRTWHRPVQTNFPDARSKFHGIRLTDGRYVLVSNPNPERRDPLALSISKDGMVFTKMAYLIGGRHVDYPHVLEHDGYLYVAFSGGKQSIEVLKIKISDLDHLKMPESMEFRR
ncbi:MAG: exo-alpha-sialidase [Bacteroidales bacterium]|nr:exo-alpha-sialidase [Bacteroidales bacterium]